MVVVEFNEDRKAVVTSDADVHCLEDVNVRLSADEIAMLAVLLMIAVGCVAILAWIIGDGPDGVAGLFGW